MGKFAIVTGGSSGLGLETALALAQVGADVLLADVDAGAGREAVARIRAQAPAGVVRHESLNLADLASIERFAESLLDMARPVDLLVNNAGVMAPRRRQVTADGYEMQLGVNFLGHFALTARLLPLLSQSRRPRVVIVSSVLGRKGKISFDDLQCEKKYRPWKAYAQASLAQILFALELQRRSDAANWRLQCNAVHPGYARTNIVLNGPGPWSMANLLHRSAGRMFSQNAAQGALPILFAATSPKANMGNFYGPRGPYELLGMPGEAETTPAMRDAALASHLWQIATELTRVSWPST